MDRIPARSSKRMGRGHRRILAREMTLPPLSSLTGIFAGTNEVHEFREMTTGLGGSQCRLCYGFIDDHRHFLPDWWQEAQDLNARDYEDVRWPQKQEEEHHE